MFKKRSPATQIGISTLMLATSVIAVFFAIGSCSGYVASFFTFVPPLVGWLVLDSGIRSHNKLIGDQLMAVGSLVFALWFISLVPTSIYYIDFLVRAYSG